MKLPCLASVNLLYLSVIRHAVMNPVCLLIFIDMPGSASSAPIVCTLRRTTVPIMRLQCWACSDVAKDPGWERRIACWTYAAYFIVLDINWSHPLCTCIIVQPSVLPSLMIIMGLPTEVLEAWEACDRTDTLFVLVCAVFCGYISHV